jgi:serine O-acetyltransferase
MASNIASVHPASVKSVDPVWSALRAEADQVIAREPALAGFIYANVLNHQTLEQAVAYRVSERLSHPTFSADFIRQTISEMYVNEPALTHVLRTDMVAVYERDPACDRFIEPALYFKGFHALQGHRLSHWLHNQGRQDFALYLQSRISEVFQVDINPAVKVGKGIFWDHATGIVIGETAMIDDDVSILQGVTLGGTGKETGDRHPKIRRGVLIGAGANILGNIEIGACSRVASGSVVLKPVPPQTTVAGIPARVVGQAGCAEPSRSMDQILAEDFDMDLSAPDGNV